MQSTNLLKAIPMSFYSKDLYGEIGQRWRGRGILYMLLLLAILCLIGTSVFLEIAMVRAGKLISVIVPQMPTLIVKEGIIQTPKNETVSIHNRQNRPIILINVSGSFKGDFRTHPAIAMVTQDALWVKYSSFESDKMEVYHLPKTWSGKIDGKTITTFYEHIKAKRYLVLYPVLFALFLVISFCYRMIYALFYAILGLVFSRMHHSHLTYAALINLSLIAMTPPLIIRFMLMVTGVPITLAMQWCLLILNIVYLYLAVKWSVYRH